MGKKIRFFLLNTILNIYNGIAFVVINIVMWRNHLWNEKKWTKMY